MVGSRYRPRWWTGTGVGRRVWRAEGGVLVEGGKRGKGGWGERGKGGWRKGGWGGRRTFHHAEAGAEDGDEGDGFGVDLGGFVGEAEGGFVLGGGG